MNEWYLKSKVINDHFNIKHIKLNYSKSWSDIGEFTTAKVLKTFLALLILIKFLIFFRPGLVYFEISPWGRGFLRDSLFAIVCKFFRRKIVFQLHMHTQLFPESRKEKSIFRYRRTVFKNTKMILLSDLFFDDVRNVFGRNDVYVLPNCTEDLLTQEEFEQAVVKKSHTKRPVLLFLSTMNVSKGPLDVLKICSLLDQQGIDFECVFSGPWRTKQTKLWWYALLNRYGLEQKCKYIGPTYGSAKKELFKKANFFIFPARFEAFSLVTLEALMYGVPVITYPWGAAREIIRHNWLGFVASKMNYHELYEYLMENIGKHFDSHKIREYFLDNYSSGIIEDRLVDIFRREAV